MHIQFHVSGDFPVASAVALPDVFLDALQAEFLVEFPIEFSVTFPVALLDMCKVASPVAFNIYILFNFVPCWNLPFKYIQ